MKIALLSFHNAVNFGAALQAYALEEVLALANYDCEYINYQNEHRKNAYNMTYHIMLNLKKGKIINAIKHLLGLPFMSLRKYRFNQFYKEHLKCTKKVYSSSLEAQELNNQYEKFIVESDQVWNFENNGADFAFLLDFVTDNNKKISYSSSFGVAIIPELLEEKYKENLLKIKHLAVREKFGADLVKKMTNRDAVLVLDPVFLLSREQWLNLIPAKKIKRNEKFIFSYTNRENQLEDFLKQTNYDLEDTKIYKLSRHLTIGDFFSRKVRQKYTMSPTDFIQNLNESELIVTASFHCVALSIILNKQFIAILTGDQGKDERIISLLEITCLQNRIFNSKMTMKKVNESIDYNKVNQIVNEYKEYSLQYLKNSIDN
jgi:hypothetical protein